MTKISKEKLEKVIEAGIEASSHIRQIIITLKGVRNSLESEIDELSAEINFHYPDDEQ